MYIDVPARWQASSAGWRASSVGRWLDTKVRLVKAVYWAFMLKLRHPPRKSAKLRIHRVAIERRIGGLSDKRDNGVVIVVFMLTKKVICFV